MSTASRHFLRTGVARFTQKEPTGVAVQGSKTVVTCRVSGTFPGSPVLLPFRFTLEGDRIGALSIGE